MKYNLDFIDDFFRDEFITLSGRRYSYRDDIYAQKYRNAIVLPFRPDLNCSTKGWEVFWTKMANMSIFLQLHRRISCPAAMNWSESLSSMMNQ